MTSLTKTHKARLHLGDTIKVAVKAPEAKPPTQQTRPRRMVLARPARGHRLLQATRLLKKTCHIP